MLLQKTTSTTGPLPRTTRAGSAAAATLILALASACGGPSATSAPTPAAGSLPVGSSPPVSPSFEAAVLAMSPCEPSPWDETGPPRLTAPFEGGGSEVAQAAGVTLLPRVRNPDELFMALGAHFMRIGAWRMEVPQGKVRLWLLIDTEGSVAALEVAESSGDPELDAAGSSVALQARMTPAVLAGCTAPVWVSYPVTFQQGRARGIGGYAW